MDVVKAGAHILSPHDLFPSKSNVEIIRTSNPESPK